MTRMLVILHVFCGAVLAENHTMCTTRSLARRFGVDCWHGVFDTIDAHSFCFMKQKKVLRKQPTLILFFCKERYAPTCVALYRRYDVD